MPGKTLPFELRERLRELKGVRLAVWLAYWLHANMDGVAWPSLGALARETGYHRDIASDARLELMQAGWLIGDVRARQAGGRFGAPRLKVAIPENRTDKTSARIKHPHGRKIGSRTDKTSARRTDKTSAGSITKEGNPMEEAARPGRQPEDEKPMAAWKSIGLDGPIGPRKFRMAWEQHFREWGGDDDFAAFVESFLVCAQDRHLAVPRGFYDAKHAIERRGQRSAPDVAGAIPTLADVRPGSVFTDGRDLDAGWRRAHGLPPLGPD